MTSPPAREQQTTIDDQPPTDPVAQLRGGPTGTESTQNPEQHQKEEELQPWVDNTGKYTVVATLVSADHKVARLRKPTGQEIAVPLERLGPVERARVEYAITDKQDATAKLIIGHPTNVMDGDTLLVEDLFGETWTVRLVGVDAPENEQPYGLDARMALRRKVVNKKCQIEWHDRDRYERVLGQLYLAKESINKTMLEDGWAWHYEKYSADAAFQLAESRARRNKMGMWKEADGIAPWDWRNGVRTATPAPVNTPSIRTTDITVYITATGEKYHRAGCRYLRKSQIAIPLSRAKSAYDPCKVCNPPH